MSIETLSVKSVTGEGPVAAAMSVVTLFDLLTRFCLDLVCRVLPRGGWKRNKRFKIFFVVIAYFAFYNGHVRGDG